VSRLSALIDPNGPVDGATARQAAVDELRRVEYHRDDPGLFTRVLDWLGRRLDSIPTGGVSGAATLALLVLLVGAIIFAVIRAGRPRRIARAAGTGLDPLAPSGLVDHRRLAADLQSQGRLAEAQREWLRATVQTIEQRGVLDPRPGRTGTGLAREAGAMLPSVAALLDEAVDAFDAVWFGRRAAVAADVELAHQAADAVRSARIERLVETGGWAMPR
jgi:hypothetical protein